MSGKKFVDHDGISAKFDEEKAETLVWVQERELAIEAGGAADDDEEATRRAVVNTPPQAPSPPQQVPSCNTASRDGDGASAPVPSPGSSFSSSRSSKRGKKGKSTWFRRLLGVESARGGSVTKERSVPEGDITTPRSAGRSLMGRKDRSRWGVGVGGCMCRWMGVFCVCE